MISCSEVVGTSERAYPLLVHRSLLLLGFVAAIQFLEQVLNLSSQRGVGLDVHDVCYRIGNDVGMGHNFLDDIGGFCGESVL